MRLVDQIWLFLAQGFGSGRMPFAPGTFGTLVGLGYAWLLGRYFPGAPAYFGITAAGFLAAVYIGQRGEQILGVKDPGSIVIDEIAVIPVVMAWQFLSRNTQISWIDWVIGFGLFRLFDIWKPWPIRQIQDVPGGWGLALDDLLAAVYAGLLILLYKSWR